MTNRIGRYEVRSRLGSGAFATVFEAFDPRLESRVAVKLLADNWIHEPEVRARFRQEAVLLRRVQTEHPDAPLVDVYDIDETDDGRPYFVMRMADRGSVAQRSPTGTVWQPSAVEPVVDVLEQALGTLHRAGIVHRDVKPSNLLITMHRQAEPTTGNLDRLIRPDERVYLGDLGLAKDLLVSGSGLTVAGGTPRYMAPEQRDPAAAIDHRADLFAATAVVVDLLTGSPELPEHHPSLSPGALAHLAKGLAADPSHRHSDATAWADAMRRALTSTPPPPAPVVSSPTLETRAGEAPERRTTRRILAVSALIAFVVAGLVIVSIRDDASPIDGPNEVTVGETVTLVADVDPGDTWVWSVGGRQVRDADLELTSDRSGFVVVDLEISSPDGSVERSTRRIQVVE